MADLLEQVLVRDVASTKVVALKAQDTLEQARGWLAVGRAGTQHSGFPVLNERGVLMGVLTRRDLETTAAEDAVKLQDLVVRLPKYVYDDCTVRQAADHMVNHGIGRLPVVRRSQPSQLIGIVTRSDILSVYRRSAEEMQTEAPEHPTPRSEAATPQRRLQIGMTIQRSAGYFTGACSAAASTGSRPRPENRWPGTCRREKRRPPPPESVDR